MSSAAPTMRTSEQIRAEVEQTFGFLPPFFEPALGSPQVLENLWQQTLFAYTRNPLSALFKEKLSALLSRFCAVPYCIIVHSSALRPLGMTARQVLALLDAPPRDQTTDLTLGALPAPAPEEAAAPVPDSPLERTLLSCATAVFLERADAQACRSELRRLLGRDLYPHLIAYLAYIKTCHAWTEAHPEVAFEADRRAQGSLGLLLAEEPALGDFFRNYRERVGAQHLANEGRRDADESLRAEQARTAGILESITDAFATFDQEWRFTYLNEQAERLLSRTREELLGRNVWEAFPESVGTISDREYHRAVEEQVTASFEQFFPPLAAWFQVRAYPSPGGLSIFFQDITEQTERRQRERFLVELAERAQRLTDPDAVIADAVRAAGEFLGVGRCVFGDIDLVADTCTIVADYCADDSVASIVGTFPFSAFGPFVVAEYRAGRSVAVDDVRLDPVRVTEANVGPYEAMGIRAHITAPVVHSARLVSVFAAHNPVPRHWKPEEVELVQIVVERTWLTVEVLRQHRALAREAETTTRILESITDAFFTLDQEFRFTHVSQEAERVLLRGRDELLNRYIWEAFPEGEGSAFDRQYRLAVTEGVPVSFEEFYRPLDAWLEVRAYPSEDGLSVFFQNVNARKKTEEERERLLAETAERAERESLLNRIGEAIRATTDPEQIQQVAARALGEALGADRCYFSFYDLAADMNWVGHDFRREDLPSLAGRYRLSDFQVNPEHYYSSGRTLVISDATAGDWRFPEMLLTALRDLRVRSAMAVPIFDGERLVAALSVAMADEPRAWTDNEVRVAEAVAAQTRSAVEAARLLAEQQASLRQEALVGRIGASIRSELDPEVIQETAAQRLGEALGADRCFYLTYDLLRDTASVGRDFRRSDLRSLAGEYRLSDFQEMLAEVFAEGTTAAIPDVRAALSPAVAQAMVSFDHRAVLAVPFFDEGRLVAALWASVGDTRAWTAQEAALMEQAATLTRTALETARVSRKEHAIAEQLQAALQPDLPEAVPGIRVAKWYEPALTEEAGVGGDFYDVFAIDKSCTALVVGDLSGKGLVAAANVSIVRNMLRAFLYSKRTLAEAVTELNRILAENSLLTGFATLFVGAFDGGTRVLNYVNCGQEPALVRRAATGRVEHLTPTGPILGSIESAQYTEETVALARGDALAIFSDGLTEIGPSRTAMLGIEGIAALLGGADPGEITLGAAETAEQLALRLITGVDAVAAGGVTRDDVCLLVAVVE